MNTYFFPRPSLRGAVLWQRSKGAFALTPDGRILGWTLLGTVLALQLLFIEPVRNLFAQYWVLVTALLVLPNLALITLIGITADGVKVRRLVTGFRPDGAVPLGGEFRRTLPTYPGEADHDEDIDFNEDDGSRWILYRLGEETIPFACLFPGPTVDWLNAQLHRIQALQLPTARTVKREPDAEDG